MIFDVQYFFHNEYVHHADFFVFSYGGGGILDNNRIKKIYTFHELLTCIICSCHAQRYFLDEC